MVTKNFCWVTKDIVIKLYLCACVFDWEGKLEGTYYRLNPLMIIWGPCWTLMFNQSGGKPGSSGIYDPVNR